MKAIMKAMKINETESPFDLKFFALIGRQSQGFLSSKKIAEQQLPDEIEWELKQLDVVQQSPKIDHNIWFYFYRKFPRLLIILITNKFFGRICFAIALILSQKLLKDDHLTSADIVVWVGFTAAMFGNLIFNYFSKIQVERLSSALGLFLSNQINKKLVDVDYSRLDSSMSPGKIKVLLSSDIKKAQSFLNGLNNNLIPTLVTLVIFLPIIFLQIGWQGLIATALIFPLMPISYTISQKIHRFQSTIQGREDVLVGIIGEWVRKFRITRYLNLEALTRDRISEAVRSLLVPLSKQHFFVVLNFSMAMIWWMIPIAVLFFLSYGVRSDLNLVSLFSVIWLLNEITNTVRYLPFTILDYSSAKACTDRILTLLNAPSFSERYLPAVGLSPTDFKPVALHFLNVEMQMSNNKIFSDLNLIIDLQKKTAVVGQVASGKSTLARLLVGELMPTSGTIFIELDNQKKYPIWSKDIMGFWQNWIAFVPQEPYLSNDKLKNNISLSDTSEDQNLLDAVHVAQLESDISSFKNGLNEEIGESGSNLSGGQKQRVNLARALYFGRQYLILDDPTSAIDSETRILMAKGLNAKKRAYLILTNNDLEISNTDRVINLDHEVLSMNTLEYLARQK